MFKNTLDNLINFDFERDDFELDDLEQTQS
jgi:hypothetical protein